ncbi:HNH endonuclease (plasmid) [Nocardiopsis flavescens]|uniref:HNH nuclease domain-containing protein n=1 Tax=Nocardiopsis flavescens TaxID=758803 RepID=A0A6M5K7U1_9ACTN|nr:hypothetical protein [Nocardiopsis flavescens]QKW32551.1 HNH endonuclease [Nocardiopsis flavescens]
MRVALQPARLEKDVLRHYLDTIDSPVDLSEYRHSMGPEYGELMARHPSGEVPLWGVVPGKANANVSKYQKLQEGDYVFFYGDKQLYLGGYISHTFRNRKLAEQLWTVDGKGQTWEYMYSLDRLRAFEVPIEEVRECLGTSDRFFIQGIFIAEDERAQNLIELCNLEEYPSRRALRKGRRRPVVPPKPPVGGGETDRRAERVYRREQGSLRDWLLASGEPVCALCGRELPDALLVAAHIKKRALCSEEERWDLENVAMLACALGCDKLFEEGYIAVGADGAILVSPEAEQEPNVKPYVEEHLRGRRVDWHIDERAGYFAWHRTRTFKAGVERLV